MGRLVDNGDGMRRHERVVRITYDEESDAAYISLTTEGLAGEASDTVPMDPLAVDGMINLDFDDENRLIGIEVLGASARLPRALLQQEGAV